MKNGFILVTFLILLAILSLLAIHAMQNSLLQNKMSYNFYVKDRLFYQTEQVLRVAETAVQTQERLNCDISTQSIAANYVLQRNLSSFSSCQVGLGGHYVVQKIHSTPEINYYRITTWGYEDASRQTPMLIQSIYAKMVETRKSTRFSWRMLYTIYQ